MLLVYSQQFVCLLDTDQLYSSEVCVPNKYQPVQYNFTLKQEVLGRTNRLLSFHYMDCIENKKFGRVCMWGAEVTCSKMMA
jgi:hypothetical protein